MLATLNQLLSLTWDLIDIAKPEQILSGKRVFRPFMKYQKSWIKHFHPNDTIELKKNTWFYLQKYMLPLINEHASSYHVEGIQRLKLDIPKMPNFEEFKKIFFHESNGFSIQPVNEEISPKEYFTLISQKKFPCIASIRPHEELFCGNEPDFWHESIGHIAPLCFQIVQDFYLELADYLLSAKTKFDFNNHLAIAWTLTEYGFLKEHGQNKMFGAALVGSHLAHMRYLYGFISIEAAERTSIINSGFYEEHSPLARDEQGNLRFFCMDQLNAKSLFTE